MEGGSILMTKDESTSIWSLVGFVQENGAVLRDATNECRTNTNYRDFDFKGTVRLQIFQVLDQRVSTTIIDDQVRRNTIREIFRNMDLS